MSHHFDTPTAREDPRINVCDFYLFRRLPGTVAMALTVNPGAGLSAPDTFCDEGLYAFRFDLDGDGVEDVTFKLRFGDVEHLEGGDHRHVQSIELRRAVGDAGRSGDAGEPLARGRTGDVIEGGGIRVFAGKAPELFAGDAKALGAFRKTIGEGAYSRDVWQNRKNFFGARNICAIVVELPVTLVGRGRVHAWATASLHGHAPEVQVSRWGLPLISNIFLTDDATKEAYNRTGPADDAELKPRIADFAERVVSLAGTAASPSVYARQLADRLCPAMLPYELDTEACFSFAGFNGRAPEDDVMEVMITLMANDGLADGVAPVRERIRDDFPYFGAIYSPEEQRDVTPARKPSPAPNGQ